MADFAAIAARALPLVDLTSLNDDDTPETIAALCRRAVTPIGNVAAVCIWPRFVAQAKALLQATGVRVATVVNFPQGTSPLAEVLTEMGTVRADGADEIDIVIPYAAYRAGERQPTVDLVTAAKQACGGRLLKVILETGQLVQPDVIAAAARDVITAGADFLKTSTGKTAPAATPQAAEVLLEVIAAHRARTGRVVGFKAAGGIRNVADAGIYLALADGRMGADYAQP
ncbi:MAG: deoxyribose-phosphate aldolase, partial [Dongiaceae bacterium]